MSQSIKVALLGNPNTGKTSVFNLLTKLNQKVGNYPGITVEKKQGTCWLDKNHKCQVFDLPGTYSLNASSIDENLVVELLLNKKNPDFPDVAVLIADIENLKRNLLLLTQVKSLGIPVILAINMADRMKRRGITLDIEGLEKELHTRVVLISARNNKGFTQLKSSIKNYDSISTSEIFDINCINPSYFQNLRNTFPNQSLYKLWLLITQDVNFTKLKRKRVPDATKFKTQSVSNLKRFQQKETIKRYQLINDVLKKTLTVDPLRGKSLRATLDRLLLHNVFGYVIFFGLLMLIFESIYDWSSIPMDFIDSTFARLSDVIKSSLPNGRFTDLLSEGLVPGIGGVVIFIPQIALLFFFLALLEESGYMSRVVFLMDKGLRKFGLSGKSVIPLVSGTACAIPAVMATRNIENWKERLITILVTPFTTCSARLPVYAILIALVIPSEGYYQSLTLMGLYLLGFVAALISSWVLHKTLRVKGSTSQFVVEMPNYKIPLIKNLIYTVWEKTKTFVMEAGKIILAISILLWILASNGPGKNFTQAEEVVRNSYPSLSGENLQSAVDSHKLEHSYIGLLGKSIEPVIVPLGYDWKVGIALISSFAAREVFVGTLATIYSVNADNQETIKAKMASEKKSDGTALFNLATGISLMLFYAFAMQCMSTLAIVRKETNSWHWPTVQLVSMTTLAYLVSLVAYQILS